MSKRRDIILGERFQYLTVIKEVPNLKDTRKTYLCICDCGNETIQIKYSLLDGVSKSCGCIRSKTHGMTNTGTYNSWNSIQDRCNNPNNKRYHDYGGRGITVCDRWLNSFENFLEDMGERPDNKTIEREDNDGNYEPGNCVWATPKEQANNRSNTVIITFEGKTQTLTQWTEELGVKPSLLRNRLDRGWTIERALTTPVQKRGSW